MRLTRWSHSCVSLESAGRTVVIDPGIWSEPRALDGAHAVLVTHEHADHVEPDRLRAAGLPVWAPRGADLAGVPFTPLDPGQEVTVEGFEVRAVGGQHAAVVPTQEVCANLGYVVTADGESRLPPGRRTGRSRRTRRRRCWCPMQASWLKTVEAIAFVREVRPQPRGRDPRRPGQRPRPGEHQPLAGDRGRLRVPLAGPRDDAG